MVSLIVVHYGEIGTKGANRPVFEESLARNIRSALQGLAGLKVKRAHQRLLVTVDDASVGVAKDRLARVFGVVWYALVETASASYPDILKTALAVLSDRAKGTSFRVNVRRSDKRFAMGSQELARKLGEDIIGALGLKVDLSGPDATLFVDVIWGQVLVYRERYKGLGGLPVGVSGSVLHLLSGGIDSPAAGWLMMKRGCRPTYLHFYLAPGPNAILDSKVVKLVRVLADYGGDADLILVPFAPYQLTTAGLPTDYEPTVFRRFVRVVAERLAGGLACPAMSTGDSLAQVASQTLQNLVCIDSGCSIPILRPLITFDKEEIVRLAKQVGTYDISLEEYKDCCSIVSRHPRTRMKVEDVDEACTYFKFEDLAWRCIRMGDMVRVTKDGVSVRPLSDLMGVQPIQPERITS